MIFFNGYLFRFESITMVTDIRVTGCQYVHYNFTIKCDGERTCFEYKTEEEAKSDRQILADAIYEYMDEHTTN